MTVPVVGSLIATVVFGLIIPHYLRYHPCQLLRTIFNVTPQTMFLLDGKKAGLCGFCIIDYPDEVVVCDSCGGHWEVDDPFHFIWRPADGSDELFHIHFGCLVGHSTLVGADFRTLAAIQKLLSLFGAKLEKDHPPLMTFSLKKMFEDFSSLCDVPLPGNYTPVSGQSSSRLKRARLS